MQPNENGNVIRTGYGGLVHEQQRSTNPVQQHKVYFQAWCVECWRGFLVESPKGMSLRGDDECFITHCPDCGKLVRY